MNTNPYTSYTLKELFASFHELISRVENPYFLHAKENGKKIIAYTCNFVPETILGLEGLVPFRVSAPAAAGTAMADVYMSDVICTYSRSILEYELDAQYTHIDGWVSATSCDHIRRFYDNLIYLQKPQFACILDLPNKKTSASIDWYTEELQHLCTKLHDVFKIDITKDALINSIRLWNVKVELIHKIGDLRKKQFPPITGAQFHTVLKAASQLPHIDFMNLASALYNKLNSNELLSDEQKPSDEKSKNIKPRIMLIGSELDDPEYIKVIEDVGLLVAADRFGNGSLPAIAEIQEYSENPLRAIAKHKLDTVPSPRMMDEFENRAQTILDIIHEYKIDAVIMQIMKFCDLWSTEAGPLITRLKKQGIQVLKLEREYHLGSLGQLRTRVQAFKEANF